MKSTIFSLLALATAALAVPVEVRAPAELVARGSTAGIPLPASSLPAPVGALKYVVLGVGTQNYTCNGASTDAPASNGAKATLYDISGLLSSPMGKYMGGSLSGLALSMSQTPLAAPIEQMFSCAVAGNHYFAAGGIPTFNLNKVKPAGFMSAKKIMNVAAPAGACPGTKQEGAVDWLLLGDNGNGLTKGCASVYRVQTAGGKAPATCAGLKGDVLVPYAAQYFFYG